MTNSIEAAKRRYSKELASYTFEQWRLARAALEAAQASAAVASSPTDSDRSPERSPSRERRHSRPTSEPQAVQQQELTRGFRAIDFAHKAPLVNGMV